MLTLLVALLPLALARHADRDFPHKGRDYPVDSSLITSDSYPTGTSTSLTTSDSYPTETSTGLPTFTDTAYPTSSPTATVTSSSATSSGGSASSSATSSSSSGDSSSAPSTPVPTYVPPAITFAPVSPARKISSKSYARLTKEIPAIFSNALQISTHSWELGAFTEALLEVYNPKLAVFDYHAGNSDIPWPVVDVTLASLYSANWTGAPANGTDKKHLEDYLNGSKWPLSPQPLVPGDGALGDPAALGPATWVLANVADKKEVAKRGNARSGKEYAWLVGSQYQYLVSNSRSDNGTISQRDGYFELWSDMGYMIPPFPAYLGLTTDNTSLIALAADQWLLENSALLDTTKDIYRHVNDWDARLWATGNGWMLGGGVRVLASAENSKHGNQIKEQTDKMEEQLDKTFKALFNILDSDSLIPNYMFQDNATLAVGDAAGTALAVASYYRFVKLRPYRLDKGTAAKVEQAFDGVMSFLDDDAWLTHVVDPLGTNGWVVYPNDPSLHSPEGQSFLGAMWAARTAVGF